MLNNTRFGRHIYAVGGNEQAALISGLNVKRIKIAVYTIAGLLSGLAGLVLSSRIGSGQPGLAVGIELDAIAAAVIGGTSLSGGVGTVWGTVIGALIIGVLNNGLEISEVSAELSTIVPGRQVDDNAHLKLRFDNGAKGLMWASMVAAGHLHGQRIRVYGDKGSLEWVQEQPEQLVFRPVDGPIQTLSRGFGWLSPAAQRSSRLWPGHPEGFLEAFANIYGDIAEAVIARRDGIKADPLVYNFPTVEDGVLGVKFVDAAVESHQQEGRWVEAMVDLGEDHSVIR